MKYLKLEFACAFCGKIEIIPFVNFEDYMEETRETYLECSHCKKINMTISKGGKSK